MIEPSTVTRCASRAQRLLASWRKSLAAERTAVHRAARHDARQRLASCTDFDSLDLSPRTRLTGWDVA